MTDEGNATVLLVCADCGCHFQMQREQYEITVEELGKRWGFFCPGCYHSVKREEVHSMAVEWKDLPKFDAVSECAACGAHTVCGFGMEFFQHGETSGGNEKDMSFIRRTCPRCGYHWREKPLYFCQAESVSEELSW